MDRSILSCIPQPGGVEPLHRGQRLQLIGWLAGVVRKSPRIEEGTHHLQRSRRDLTICSPHVNRLNSLAVDTLLSLLLLSYHDCRLTTMEEIDGLACVLGYSPAA